MHTNLQPLVARITAYATADTEFRAVQLRREAPWPALLTHHACEAPPRVRHVVRARGVADAGRG